MSHDPVALNTKTSPVADIAVYCETSVDATLEIYGQVKPCSFFQIGTVHIVLKLLTGAPIKPKLVLLS